MTYKEIYCSKLSQKDWATRFSTHRHSSRSRVGLAFAEKRDGRWVCLHCGSRVRVVE